MKPFTFDQIPVMINKIHYKLEYLEKLFIRFSIVEENIDEILNIQKASKLLNLSVSTIYSKVCKKGNPRQ